MAKGINSQRSQADLFKSDLKYNLLATQKNENRYDNSAIKERNPPEEEGFGEKSPTFSQNLFNAKTY